MEKQQDLSNDHQTAASDQQAIPTGEHTAATGQHGAVKKHSGIGIASFTLGIIAIVMSIALTIYIFGNLANFLLSQQIDPNNAQLMEEAITKLLETNPFLLVVFPLFLVAGLMHVIGAILGLVGLFQDHRKKFFAGFGLGLNILPIAGFIILFLFGLMIS